MRSYIVIECDSPTLTVEKIGLPLLKAAKRGQTEMIWINEGEGRCIPQVQLQDSYYRYDAGQNPEIHWNDCERLPRDLEVRFNPRPTTR